MSKEYSRMDRVGELISRQLAKLIQTELRDPRVGMVTISGVNISKDLRHAKIFITMIGDELTIKTTIAALTSARHFLRKELAKHITLRVTPELTFAYDDTAEKGYHLSKLIDDAAARKDE